jgi:Cyclic nucleotide-binding domain
MRMESSVTSVSWIPSEVPTGLLQAGFNLGLAHYDDPPPEVLQDLDALFAAERFRFANHLAAWIEVTDGAVVDAGYNGRGYISCTRFGGKYGFVFQPTEFPEIRQQPEITATGARFVQTTGGRTGAPMPRPVSGRPHVQWVAPTVWTTLALTISVDGSAAGEVTGASRFPRHWIYGHTGRLIAKSATADLQTWLQVSHGEHTPWGNEDTEPLVALVETALERQLSAAIMHGGAKPAIRRLPAGSLLTEQGAAADDLYLLLDGLLSVSADGRELGELGPGAIIGERAIIEGGRRTATVRAVTDCVVAVAARDQIDRSSLARLAQYHHREDAGKTAEVLSGGCHILAGRVVPWA